MISENMDNANTPSLQTGSFDELLSSLPEMSLKPDIIRRHIVDIHLSPRVLLETGIPRYELGICSYRKIDLSRVVEQAYEKLGTPDQELQAQIDKEKDRCLSFGSTIDAYKRMLVKTLKYIESYGLAAINWANVETLFNGARSVRINIVETTDTSFFEKLATLEDMANHRPTTL